MNPVEAIISVSIAGSLTAVASVSLTQAADLIDTSGLAPVSECMEDALADSGVGVVDAIAGIRDDTLDAGLRRELEVCAYVITGDPNDPWAGVPDDLLEDLGVER